MVMLLLHVISLCVASLGATVAAIVDVPPSVRSRVVGLTVTHVTAISSSFLQDETIVTMVNKTIAKKKGHFIPSPNILIFMFLYFNNKNNLTLSIKKQFKRKIFNNLSSVEK